MKTIMCAVLLSTLAWGAAVAQDPCPCPPAVPPPPPQWFGTANLSFLSTSGNTRTSTIGGGLEVNYKPDPWLFTFKAAYLRASTDDVTTAESLAGSLRGARDLTPRVDVYVESTYQRNRFAGLNSLVGGDGGGGYKILVGPVHALRVEAGVGYTHESDTVGPSRDYANGHAGLGYKWTFSKTANFSNDFAYMLDFSDSSNWFITDKAAVTAALSSIFSLQASWTLLYRNEPVLGFRKTDTATAVALVAKF